MQLKALNCELNHIAPPQPHKFLIANRNKWLQPQSKALTQPHHNTTVAAFAHTFFVISTIATQPEFK